MGIAEGRYNGKPNPHAWMSPTNALIYVENIRKALVKHDPPTPSAYTANAAAYTAQIKAIDEPLRKRLDAIPAEPALAGDRARARFSYLTRDYDMQEALSLADQRRRAGHAAAGPQGHRPACARTRFRSCSAREHDLRRAPPSRSRMRPARSYGGVLYVDLAQRTRTVRCRPISSCSKVTVETDREGVSASERTARTEVPRATADAGASDLGAQRHRDLRQRLHRPCATPSFEPRRRHDLRAGRRQRQRASRPLFKAIMGFVKPSTGERAAVAGLPVARGAEDATSSPTCRRARTSTGISRCWSRRGDDGPLRSHGISCACRRAPIATRSTRRWSASA